MRYSLFIRSRIELAHSRQRGTSLEFGYPDSTKSIHAVSRRFIRDITTQRQLFTEKLGLFFTFTSLNWVKKINWWYNRHNFNNHLWTTVY